jgi:hypothetical protein
MTELGLLRTRLRAVNMQCSAVLKVRGWPGALRKMAELRAERQVLMALIAAHRRTAGKEPIRGHALSVPRRSAGSREVAFVP